MNNSLAKRSILETFALELEGEFYHNDTIKVIYASIASVYRELPLAVAIPKNDSDLKKPVLGTTKHKSLTIES